MCCQRHSFTDVFATTKLPRSCGAQLQLGRELCPCCPRSLPWLLNTTRQEQDPALQARSLSRLSQPCPAPSLAHASSCGSKARPRAAARLRLAVAQAVAGITFNGWTW